MNWYERQMDELKDLVESLEEENKELKEQNEELKRYLNLLYWDDSNKQHSVRIEELLQKTKKDEI